MSPLLYRLLAWKLRHLIVPLYARVAVTGLDNVPRDGPLVIACNHLNDADGALLMACLPRTIAFMAKAELFAVPLLGRLLRALGAIPVRRNEADLSALRHANAALHRGLALGIFPEGRSTTHEASLSEAWPGAALVALRADAPVLPVAITGAQRLQLPFFPPPLFHRHQVTLTIGEPFHLAKPSRLNSEAAAAGTASIMLRIAALLPPAYRGYYGDDAAATSTTVEGGPGG